LTEMQDMYFPWPCGKLILRFDWGVELTVHSVQGVLG
jgi:hypothetical protein